MQQPSACEFSVGDRVLYTEAGGGNARHAVVEAVSSNTPTGEELEIAVRLADGTVRDTVVQRLARAPTAGAHTRRSPVAPPTAVARAWRQERSGRSSPAPPEPSRAAPRSWAWRLLWLLLAAVALAALNPDRAAFDAYLRSRNDPSALGQVPSAPTATASTKSHSCDDIQPVPTGPRSCRGPAQPGDWQPGSNGEVELGGGRISYRGRRDSRRKDPPYVITPTTRIPCTQPNNRRAATRRTWLKKPPI